MHIRQQALSQLFRTHIVQPAVGITQEETFSRALAVQLIIFSVLFGFDKSIPSQQYAAKIRNILAQCGLTVDIFARQWLISIKLVDHYCSALVEVFFISCSPPVLQITLFIKLTTLIIETMCNLMSDSRSTGIAVYKCIVQFLITFTRNSKDTGR
ncbi:hypothetical protein D3C72_830000 [compost metagenome]